MVPGTLLPHVQDGGIKSCRVSCNFSVTLFKQPSALTMYHPSRGGVRGGADQFGWESIKSDKHRENYLGHSLMAPVGRWQKNKDLQWFSREKKGASSSKDAEKEAIRRMEADAMAAALGHAPAKRVAATSQLTKQELDEAFRKGQTERDDKDIERIEGMGFGSTRASLIDSGSMRETMSAIGSQVPKEHGKKDDRTTDQTHTDTKEGKRERKKEKKEKHKKKKSKASKRSKRHDCSSDSDNSESDYKRERRHGRRKSDDDVKNAKSRSRRKRHDSTSDTESESRNVRTSELKSKVKRRHDSTSDDEPHSRKKQSSDRNKARHFSSDVKHKHCKYDRKEPRRQRHDSYSD